MTEIKQTRRRDITYDTQERYTIPKKLLKRLGFSKGIYLNLTERDSKAILSLSEALATDTLKVDSEGRIRLYKKTLYKHLGKRYRILQSKIVGDEIHIFGGSTA